MDLLEKHFITNELTLKRYRRFKRDRVAVFSFWAFLFLFFISFSAELWANSKPHLLYYKGELYVPLVKDYYPTKFGRTDIYVMDYRSLKMGKGDWAVWPLIQWDPYESNKAVESYPSAPSKENIFGTDDSGRDVLTRLIYGLRYTLTFALGAWVLMYIVGCFIGANMGYWGGKVDLMGMRVVEVIQNTPVLFVNITLISIFVPGLTLLILLTVAFGWTGICMYMRGQFLQLRKREYVEAARALGASHSRIIMKHILPNALTPIVTFAPFTIAANVYWLSVMDYLGLGLVPPTPSWGELMSQSEKYFTTSEWLVWSSLGAMVITLTLLINIGLAVRDAFDSRSAVG
jgi:microcin C transport system permease protein